MKNSFEKNSLTSRSSNNRCIILGGGGHAHVIIDCLSRNRLAMPIGILDPHSKSVGQEVMGIPILGDDGDLPKMVQKGITLFVVGVGGVGDNQPRQRLFELALSYGLKPLTVIHPAATCSEWATVGEGSVIFPGSVVNAGSVLGVNVIINTGVQVEHDCQLEDHVHVATGATLCGGVHVEKGAHIGAGATIRQNIRIGEEALVGVGSVVVKDVPRQTTVIGVPARPFIKGVVK